MNHDFHENLTSKLLDWYQKNRRVLPWRQDPTPYHVWLSEIMLQQTRVEAVKSYYARFLAALPDIESLAAASEDECAKLWQGLGYYSRVRNLRKAACVITSDLAGSMPETYDGLRGLPGIGPYTAAAIASIAFGEAAPAVDGNLLRIWSRMQADPSDIKKPAGRRLADAWYRQLMEDLPEAASYHPDRREPDLPAGSADGPRRFPAGDFNQALMDLGATVCLPNGAPLCGACPWADSCRAHAEGAETKYPVRAPKKARRTEDRTVLLIHDGRRLLLDRRPAEGLLAGLYEFPNFEGRLTVAEAEAFAAGLGLEPAAAEELTPAKHIFSHVEWHMTGWAVRVRSLDPLDAGSAAGSGPAAGGGPTGIRPATGIEIAAETRAVYLTLEEPPSLDSPAPAAPAASSKDPAAPAASSKDPAAPAEEPNARKYFPATANQMHSDYAIPSAFHVFVRQAASLIDDM